MTAQEKRLLYFFLIILIVYGLPFEFLPRALNYYWNYQHRIEKLKADIQYYRRLGEDMEDWQKQYQQAMQRRNEFNNRLLQVQEGNPELLSASIQGLLKGLARNTGVSITASDLPELAKTGDWTLITQAMEFSAGSNALMQFLQAVKNAKEYLAVVKLEVRVNGALLTGKIKITGFSRVLSVENPVNSTQ